MTITNNQDLIYLANTSLFVQDYNNEYIYISEMPDYLGKGKNSFLIGIRRNCFEPNTLLNVFFLDKNGHSIPVVVTEYKQRMMIRCYIQIDQSYPVGFGTFVVIGCLSSYNNAPVPANQKLKANIKYQKQIYVNPYEKTPSALRLRHKPDIKLFVDQKKLYKYDMKTQSEYLNISNISIDEQHNDFICLQIDTASISQSIYYEKFINYKVVDNINEVTGFNTIFSGSIVTTDYLPTLGEYYGHLHSVNGESVLDYGDVKIEGGLLQLGNISNNQIQLLTGKNINQLNIDFLVEGKSSLFGKYYIYLENQNFLNIQNLQLGQSSSKIKQIQYVSKIDKANNISLVTHYLSGSVNISGGLFSENLLIVTGSQPILGSYKNFEIKNPDIFEKQEILSGQLKNNYQITHSNQNIMVNATGKTILTNCFLQNTYIGHKNSTDITTFDYIEGKLFSTNLFTTQQENSLGNSYFSGSLKGVGKFYTKTSGSSLYANNELINIYDSESLIQIQLDYLFIGDGYNANLQIEQFTGSIYSSSLIDQQYYLYDYYPEITYSKMLIESSKFKLNVLNINNLEIVVPNGYTTFPVFNIQINNINSYINLKSLTPFTISSDANKYDIFGYFNLNRGKVLQSEFSGYYQQSLGFKQLQFYDMIDCTLTSKYNNIFGTKQVYFFDNNYSKLYIPIAMDLNNNVQGLKPFITSSINTNSMEVEIYYVYKNKLKQPE